MSDSTPAVVLLSGGMDSTVLVHHVVRDLGRSPVWTLAFDYGQQHARELDAAAAQSALAGAAEHTAVDLRSVSRLVAKGTALIAGGSEVPDLDQISPEELDQPPTYVPNRNMMLLSIAAAFAEAQGAREVYYGAQAHDEYGYWDCTADFLDRINNILALNRRDAVTICAPFVAKKKEAIVSLGLELGVDFAQTWSCYRGGADPCETCPTCIERTKAFDIAGVTDPLSLHSSR